MINYLLKEYRKFIKLCLAFILVTIVTISAILYTSYKLFKQYNNPDLIYDYIIENKKDNIYLTNDNCKYLKNKNIWAIRLNENGEVVESFNKPAEVKNKFTLSDVGQFTRYYLDDYPVFTFVAGDGLIIFAYPKNSLDKLPFNYYNYDAFVNNLYIIIFSVVIFLLVIYLFYILEIKKIYKNLNPLLASINNLFKDDYVKLDEIGELKEISKTINKANKKYIKIKNSRANWLRGISHDIRTPLTKLSWGLEEIKTTQNQEQILIMNNQIQSISKIIEDLNLTERLDTINRDYFVDTDPLIIIRKLIVNELNEHQNKNLNFENLINTSIELKMDEHLFYRMLFNIVENSLKYSKSEVTILTKNNEENFIVEVINQDSHISDEIIQRLFKSDISNIETHGLGLFISKQICELHNGTMDIENLYPGVKVRFTFPL
ncbi:sensor histidine kinase [Anaerococcus cruorum]|uniref:sensor histidine kinase n=1 Tax=Anaerococcus sp. WGS1529 TaxID=3366812 RepID=UPI00372D1CC4